nr:hypothetical protein [uncultured Sphaerochaeta sp.]
MKTFCVLGDHRAAKSLSPRMHNAVLKQYGLTGWYVAFTVAPDRIGPAIAGLRALNVAGANVTVPHKETVGRYLDEITDEVRAVGAVNTIVPTGGRWVGHNTDVGGFIDALAEASFRPGRTGKALVFGAGGAARAVVAALRQMDMAEIVVGRAHGRTD